jgi:hypothetical protein
MRQEDSKISRDHRRDCTEATPAHVTEITINEVSFHKLNPSRHAPPKEKLEFTVSGVLWGTRRTPLGLRCESVSPPLQPSREALGASTRPSWASLCADGSDACVVGNEKTAEADTHQCAALGPAGRDRRVEWLQSGRFQEGTSAPDLDALDSPD